MTVSNPKWLDDELEQLLSWWEANYETTISENVKPATWTSQVREAGLSTRTCPQIKQKWHNWTFSYKKARKIALKSCWENSSDVTTAGAALLDRICPKYWRLHSLLDSTEPTRPLSDKNSEKEENDEASREAPREAPIADPAPTVALDENCSVNFDEICLPQISQSSAPSLLGSSISPNPTSFVAISAPSSGQSTPRKIDNQGSSSGADIRRIESSLGGDNIEENKHMPVKWSAKTTNIWAALIYEADQRRHIEEAKINYAKLRDEKKAQHEIALRKLDMDEAQRQRENELEIMNKKIQLENIKLEYSRNRGNKHQ